jgi:hypothetical protein
VALVTVADGVCMRVGGGWITVAAVVMLWVDGCVGCWRFFGLPFRVSRTRTTHLQLPINHHARATPPSSSSSFSLSSFCVCLPLLQPFFERPLFLTASQTPARHVVATGSNRRAVRVTVAKSASAALKGTVVAWWRAVFVGGAEIDVDSLEDRTCHSCSTRVLSLFVIDVDCSTHAQLSKDDVPNDMSFAFHPCSISICLTK